MRPLEYKKKKQLECSTTVGLCLSVTVIQGIFLAVPLTAAFLNRAVIPREYGSQRVSRGKPPCVSQELGCDRGG